MMQPGPAYPAQNVPFAPPPAQAPASQVAAIVGVLGGFAALGLGFLTFLIAGFEGHSAGWEMMAIPTLLTMGASAVGGVAGIVALVRKSIGGGIAAIALSGLGTLLALVGFVLGA